jgi:hypothetical protein
MTPAPLPGPPEEYWLLVEFPVLEKERLPEAFYRVHRLGLEAGRARPVVHRRRLRTARPANGVPYEARRLTGPVAPVLRGRDDAAVLV